MVNGFLDRLRSESLAVALFFIITVITVSLFYLQTRTDVNPLYLDFYLPLGILVTAFASLALVLMFIKTDPGFANIAFLVDMDPRRRPLFKFGIVLSIIFAVTTTVAMVTQKTIFYPIPVSVATFQVSPTFSTFLSSIPPGIFEDFMFGVVLASVFSMTLISFFKIKSKAGLMGSYLMAAVFAGIVFTTMHHAVYGENLPAFGSAFFFMMVQSFIYQASGIFLPIAHPLHNIVATTFLRFNIAFV